MERAVRAFLAAAGVPVDDPDLAQTPQRVTAAWADELIDGYRTSPATALGELLPAPGGGELVCVTHIDYVSVCPHHLLPYRGVAHVGYRPTKLVVGFGRFAALVDAFAHRLILQEALAQQIAAALVETLGAAGAGVILQAEQTCMTVRGERRVRSRATVEASAGDFDEGALARLWSAVITGGPSTDKEDEP
jgi:GTP cyclohydrolase I